MLQEKVELRSSILLNNRDLNILGSPLGEE